MKERGRDKKGKGNADRSKNLKDTMETVLMETAKSLVAQGHCVTGDLLVASVGGPFAVPGLTMGDTRPVPKVVQYLFELQKRIDSVLTCLFATRPILTLADLESHVVHSLNRACTLSLEELSRRPTSDPNEIEVVDYVDGPAFVAKSSFEEFRIGAFFNYPLILQRFHCAPRITSLTAEDVVRCIAQAGGGAALSAIQSRYGTQDVLHDLGVILSPDTDSYLRPFVKQALQPLLKMQDAEGEEEKRPAKRMWSFGKVPKLRAPAQDSSVGKLLAKYEAKAESSFPPSFSKIRKLVEGKIRPDSSTLLDVACEHLLLFVGSSKYRLKKFEAEEQQDNKLHGQESEEQGDEQDDEQDGGEIQSEQSGNVEKKADHPTPALQSDNDERTAKRAKICVEDTLLHLSNPVATKQITNEQLRPFLPSSLGVDQRNIKHIGRWGEALVYNYLEGTLENWQVKWLNEEQETMASYDIHIMDKQTNSFRTSRFIEVKSSRYGNKNTFELSLCEWEFFSKSGGQSINYDIYRVYNAGDPDRVYISVVENPYRLLQEQKVHLCMAI